jgi:transposase
MKQRSQFLTDHQRGLYSMRELCAPYGVSRKTGCKWLARHAAEGARGLAAPSPAARRAA